MATVSGSSIALKSAAFLAQLRLPASYGSLAEVSELTLL